ncbi:MAG: protein-disulfide reductase DsbD N-terminal domain-containing protein, partial [Acidobacteriota bacterium]|nr:protein-disulfide reductase DsbD N-terminal domain-containing protein [Acidobacteriota bacterium]
MNRYPTRLRSAALSLLCTLGTLGTMGALGIVAATTPALRADIPRPQKAHFVLNAGRSAYDAGTAARIAALVSIEHGWHVNSHTPSFEYLIPTELTLTLPKGWPQPSIRYPQAQKKKFTFAEEPLSVYDGDFEIAAEIAIPPSTPRGTYPIKAALHYQSCDDNQCLPPVTAEAAVELHVGAGGKAAAAGTDPRAGTGAGTPLPGSSG